MIALGKGLMSLGCLIMMLPFLVLALVAFAFVVSVLLT